MHFRVVKIEDIGLERAMLDTVADQCLEHAMNVTQHPRSGRRSAQALICFNAEEVLEHGGDTEFYINDVAWGILTANNINLEVEQEINRLPVGHGTVFSSPYWN